MDFNIHGGPGSSPPQIKRGRLSLHLKGLCCSVSKGEEERKANRETLLDSAVMAVARWWKKEKRKWPWEGRPIPEDLCQQEALAQLESLYDFLRPFVKALSGNSASLTPWSSKEVPTLSALGTATQWERPAIFFKKTRYQGNITCKDEHDKGQARKDLNRSRRD